MSVEGWFFEQASPEPAALPGRPQRVGHWISEPPDSRSDWNAAISQSKAEEGAEADVAPHLPVDAMLRKLSDGAHEARPATQLNVSRVALFHLFGIIRATRSI